MDLAAPLRLWMLSRRTILLRITLLRMCRTLDQHLQRKILGNLEPFFGLIFGVFDCCSLRKSGW